MPKMKNLFGKKDKKNTEKTKSTVVPEENQQYVDREPKEENPQKYIHTDTAGGRNKEMVLHYLGINDDGEEKQLSQMVLPEEISDVEFSIATPYGLDKDEVEHFCNTMEANVAKYRELIASQKEDKEKLIKEVLRVDRQVQDIKQETLMAGSFGEDDNRVNQLNEKVLSLKEELAKEKQRSLDNSQSKEQDNIINDLRAKVKSYEESQGNSSKQVEELQHQLQLKDEELSSQKTEYEQRITKLTSNVNDDNTLQQENDNLSQKVKVLTGDVAELTTKLHDTSNVDKLTKELNEIKSENNELHAQINKLTNERNDAVKISTAANSDGQAQLDEMTSRYKSAQQKIKKLEEELKSRPKESKTEEELRLENLKLKENQGKKELSSKNSDYEDEVMKRLGKKQPIAKKQRQLSKDDIKRMKESESSLSLDLSKPKKEQKPKTKEKPKKSSSDDSFNSMFDDMSNNY